MKKQLPIILIIFILFISYTYADGVCTLDKEYYNAGQIATLSCGCDSNNEEDEPGFIVFMVSNGTILQSTATDSGPCQTNVFGSSYMFTSDANFTGNATFSLNADGTGIPPNWEDDPGDTPSDNFTVSSFSTTGCSITDITIPSSIILNRINGNTFIVKDGLGGFPILHASCRATIFASDGTPILLEPDKDNLHTTLSNSEGKVVLLEKFDDATWELNRTYTYSINCHCTNTTDEWCYNANTGDRLEYKTCSVSAIFSIGDEDYRLPSPIGFIGMVLILIISVALVAYFSRNTEDEYVKGFLGTITFFLIYGIMNFGANYVEKLGVSEQILHSIILIQYAFGSIMLGMMIYMVLKWAYSMLVGFGIIKPKKKDDKGDDDFD